MKNVLKKMFYGHENAVYSMIILNNNDIVTGSCDEIKIILELVLQIAR